MARRYWLMKTEPETYSIDDLARDGHTAWDGVRNFQARNFMRDDMKKGDLILFYHSVAKDKGVAGIARVSREAYPDQSAFDKRSKYFDRKSEPGRPVWFNVDVEFVERFDNVVTLHAMKNTHGLEDMMVTRKGARLSIQPAEKAHYEIVVKMGRDPLAAGLGARAAAARKKAAKKRAEKKKAAGNAGAKKAGGKKAVAKRV